MERYWKYLLFYSSYLPLYVLLLIRVFEIPDFKENQGFLNSVFQTLSSSQIIILFGMIIFSIIIIKVILSKETNRNITLPSSKEFSNSEETIISYLVTYIFPLMALDLSDFREVIINVLFYVMLSFIYVRYDLVFLNPLLSFLGYRVYRDESNNKIISKLTINELKDFQRSQRDIGLRKLADDVYIYKKV